CLSRRDRMSRSLPWLSSRDAERMPLETAVANARRDQCQTSSFQFNAVGQPTQVSLPGETVTYGYGANGRTESVTDNRGQTLINAREIMWYWDLTKDDL